jgi:hypothetical protein
MAESQARMIPFVERMPRPPLVGRAPLNVLDHRSAGRYPAKKDSPLVVVRHRRFRIRGIVWYLLYSLPAFHRRWCLGKQYSRRLGLGYYKFRILDRYRSRRHIDLCDSLSLPAEMANGYQPVSGSDDVVRGDVCRHFSRNSRRPRLDGLVFRHSVSPIHPGFPDDRHVRSEERPSGSRSSLSPGTVVFR